MPGGYIQHEGMAVLSTKSIAFIISDTIALIFSTIYLLHWRVLRRNKTWRK